MQDQVQQQSVHKKMDQLNACVCRACTQVGKMYLSTCFNHPPHLGTGSNTCQHTLQIEAGVSVYRLASKQMAMQVATLAMIWDGTRAPATLQVSNFVHV